MKIALLGGTGDIGAGLALRLALLGYEVIIGSRKIEKATSKCEEYIKTLENVKRGCTLAGKSNEDAAREADVSILTIPWEHAFSTAESLKESLEGKIVVSPIVPMEKKGGCFQYCPPEAGSAAEEIARILPNSRIVSAFQTVPAAKFCNLDAEFEWDIPVCSDDDEAKKVVMDIINRIDGLRALDAGLLSVSRMVESITPLLVNIMIRNKIKHLSVRFC
jgi:hypothetical protein